MKKFLFFLTLLCIEKSLHAQTPYVYTIKADSVKITNSCDTAELIIENHTQNVPGFLFNKGRGRTEFRRVNQFNDTSVVIGGDTIHLGRGYKNFANADLTFTGDRVHNGMYKYLNLNDFGGIYMRTKSYQGWPDATLSLDTLEGFKLAMADNTVPSGNTSLLNIYPEQLLFNLNEPSSGSNTSVLMYPYLQKYNTSKTVNTNINKSSMELRDYYFGMGTSLNSGTATCGISGGQPQSGEIELDITARNGLIQVQSDNYTSGETFYMQFWKADSIVMTHGQGGIYNGTRFVQYKDKFIFRNYTGVTDFRLIGLPASTTTADSMLVVDNNGQVKKRSQSPTRKSATVTASSYTVPADIDVVFVNYTGGTATITLPSGTLDREITIKNLNTTNSVALSGLDSSESNSVATRGAITVKYTGSAWVGISKY